MSTSRLAAENSDSLLDLKLSPSASDENIPRSQKEMDSKTQEKIKKHQDIGRMEILTGIKTQLSDYHASHSNESIVATSKPRKHSFVGSEVARDSVSQSEYLLAEEENIVDSTKDLNTEGGSSALSPIVTGKRDIETPEVLPAVTSIKVDSFLAAAPLLPTSIGENQEVPAMSVTETLRQDKETVTSSIHESKVAAVATPASTLMPPSAHASLDHRPSERSLEEQQPESVFDDHPLEDATADEIKFPLEDIPLVIPKDVLSDLPTLVVAANQTDPVTLLPEQVEMSIDSISPSVGPSFTESKHSDSVSITNSVAYSVPLERLDRDSTKSSFSSGLDSLSLPSKNSYDVGVKLIVVKAYRAQDLDEIDLELGDQIDIEECPIDDFWVKGIISNPNKRNNGQRGYFPKEHITFFDTEKGGAQPEASQFNLEIMDTVLALESHNNNLATIQAVPKGTAVVALFSFEPSKQDELQFAAGATIIVTECPDGGWWKGSTGMDMKNSTSGWFPANLVKIADDKKAEKVKDEAEDVSAGDNLSPQKQISWFKRLRNGETPPATESSLQAIAKRGRSSTTNNVHSFLNLSPMLEGSTDSLAPANFEKKLVSVSPDDSIHPRASSVSIVKESNGGTFFEEANSLRGRVSASSRGGMGTMILSNALTQVEIMQGASEEKVQDKVSPSLYKLLTEQEKKRLSVVWELVQTEKDYVRDLTIIIEVFMKPMTNMQSLGVKNIQTLFANIEQILVVNTDFLVQLIQIEDIRNITAFAEIFLTMGERFMCYIPYCSNQQSSSAKFMKTLLSKGEVKVFLDDTYRNPVVRQLDLPGFLLKPVQRICKYPLLLKELIKNTPADHSDLVVLNRAIERMQNAVATINECAKRLNGMKPVLEVQSRFSEKINIANANRFLVREDIIQVLFSNGKKSRKLFLFNDLLILARKDWRDKHHVIEKTSIKDIRVCDISETNGNAAATPLMELEILPSSEFDMPNRYIISAPTLADKQYWLDAYKSLVRYHVKSKNITDITMTSSNADGGDDDDISKEPTEAEKKAAIDAAAETQKKPLLQKIEYLEKVVVERDRMLKDWEARVLSADEAQEKRENELKARVEELTTRLIDSENKVKILSEEARKELMEKDALEKNHATFVKEKSQIIEHNIQLIEKLTEEKEETFSKVQNIASIIGVRLPPMKNRGSFSSIPQLRTSIVNTLAKASDSALNQNEQFMSLLDQCEITVDDLVKQLTEKTGSLNEKSATINSMVEQINSLKKEFTEKEGLLSSNVASFQKKLTESEELHVEYSNQVVAFKKEKIQLDATIEDLKSQARKLNVEYENCIFEIKSQLKREVDKSKSITDQLTETAAVLQSKDAQLKKTVAQLDQLEHRLQSTQGDMSEKDSAVKQLMDKSNSMKEIIEDIQNYLSKAKSECIIEIECSGGVVAQVKSFLSGTNNALSEYRQKILVTEQAKLNETQELQGLNAKLKEKLAEKKIEVEDVKEELNTTNLILNQLKTNLEQSRAIIEHMKISTASGERQQKQSLAALDESKREILFLNQKIDELQTNIQSVLASRLEFEKKVLDQFASIQELTLLQEGLGRKLKEKELKYVEMENSFKNEINSKDEVIRSLSLKHDALQKNNDFLILESEKQLKNAISELNFEKQNFLSHKSHANEEITDMKQEISSLKDHMIEYQRKLDANHQLSVQKENRILELEHIHTNLKSKINEMETAASNLQGKLNCKDIRIEECETDINYRVKLSNQLQSKIADFESLCSSLKLKVSETETSLAEAQNDLAISKSNSAKLESKLIEARSFQAEQSEIIRTSERERKDLIQDIGKLTHANETFIKEARQYRDRISDLNANLIKLEAQLSGLQRDNSTVLSALEEKHKNLFSKAKSDFETDISHLKYEHSKEKQALLLEMKVLHTQLADRSLDIENLTSKYSTNVQQLKQELANMGDQMAKSEKALLTKDFILKALERDHVKAIAGQEKLESELEKLGSHLKSIDEGHMAKQRELSNLVDEKSRLLQKKEIEIESLSELIEEKNNMVSELKFQAQITDQDLSETRKRVDHLTSFLKENEARMLSENTNLKGKKHDVEILHHESLLLIERMKAGEESLKVTIENLRNDLKILEEKFALESIKVDELKSYKLNAGSQITYLEGALVMKESELKDLKVSIKRIQKEAKKTFKVELEALRTQLLDEKDQLLDKETQSHQAEVKILAEITQQLEEECRDEKRLNSQYKANIELQQNEIKNLNSRKDELQREAEDLSIRLGEAEIKYHALKEEHSFKISQFANDLNVTKQQLSTSFSDSFKIKEDFNSISAQTRSIVDQMKMDINSKQSLIDNLEPRVAYLQKSLSKQSKLVSTYQMTYIELAHIVQIHVDKSAMDGSLLVLLVSTIRQKLEEMVKLESLKLSQEKEIEELVSKDSKNQDLLKLAQSEVECMETKFEEADAYYAKLVEDLRDNAGKLQIKLASATKECLLHKRQYKSVTEKLGALMDQKASLEKDYILVYEKMQEMKRDYETRNRSLSSETVVMIDQKNQINSDLKEFREKAVAMSEKIKQLLLEKHILVDQKSRTESVLKSSKSTIANLSLQIESLVEENNDLRKQYDNTEQKGRVEAQIKSSTIEELKMEIARANQKIATMSLSLKDATSAVEEFKSKLQSMKKYEKELETKNASLHKELIQAISSRSL